MGGRRGEGGRGQWRGGGRRGGGRGRDRRWRVHLVDLALVGFVPFLTTKDFGIDRGCGGSMESCCHPGGLCAAGPEMRTDQFLS